MAKNNNLTDFLTDMADTIRELEGSSDPIDPQDFADRTRALASGGGDDAVVNANISTYKYQDMQDALMNGAVVATDQEYESTEIYLQSLYHLIMEGNNE